MSLYFLTLFLSLFFHYVVFLMDWDIIVRYSFFPLIIMFFSFNFKQFKGNIRILLQILREHRWLLNFCRIFRNMLALFQFLRIPLLFSILIKYHNWFFPLIIKFKSFRLLWWPWLIIFMLLFYPVDDAWGHKNMITIKFMTISMWVWLNTALLWDAYFFREGCPIILILLFFSFIGITLRIILKTLLRFKRIQFFFI